jgi:uncharacterized protein involved in exopolysaccharide biosynthesis/Mrp family chromosome partitioning ATPase
MPEHNTMQKRMTLRDILYVMFKHKTAIAVVMLACIGAGVLYAYIVPIKYEAVAKLIVEPGGQANGPDMGTAQNPSPAEITTISYSEKMRSEIELLRSHSIAVEVSHKLGAGLLQSGESEPTTRLQKVKQWVRHAYRGVSEWVGSAMVAAGLQEEISASDRTVLLIERGLKTDLVRNSNVISVSFSAGSPELAASVVNEVIDQYLTRRMVIHRAPNAVAFLEQQRDESRMQLSESEKALNEFRDKWDVANLETQIGHLLKLEADIRSEAVTTDIELARLDGRMGQIEQLLRSGDPNVTMARNSGQLIDTLKLRVMELKLKRVDMATKYAADTPLVMNLDTEIAEAESMLQKEKDDAIAGPGRYSQHIDAESMLEQAKAKNGLVIDRAALRSKREKLGILLNGVNDELKQLGGLQSELRRLERTIDLSEKRYDQSFEKAEDAKIQQAREEAQISNIRVMFKAMPPVLGKRTLSFVPQRVLYVVMSLLVGVFMGITVISLLEILDHSFRGADDTEAYLGVPVLATVAEDRWIRRRWRRLRRQAAAGHVEPSGAPDAERQPPLSFRLNGSCRKAVADQLESMVTKLRLQVNGKGPGSCIMVTGSVAMEGVAVVCRHMIHAAAGDVSRILLIEADPHAGRKGEAGNPPQGLSDVVMGKCGESDSIYATDIKGVSYMPPGRSVAEVDHAVAAKAFETLVQSLRKRFDMIVIDAPPLVRCPQYIPASSAIDGVVLVVSAEKTRREVVHRALASLKATQATVKGVVLNRRRHYTPGWLYRMV